MRTACLALLATTIWLSAASAQQWRAQPIMQALHTPKPIGDVAVSSSGNQIAWVNSGGLSIHYLRDSGAIGDLDKRIDIYNLSKVAFVPGGNQIICAGMGEVFLINRST